MIRPELWNAWHFTIFVRQHQELIAALEILAAADFDRQFRGKVKGLVPRVFNEFLSLPLDAEYGHWCSNPGKAKLQFGSVQGLIAEWCMADFSWHRELWGWSAGRVTSVYPVDISATPLPDNWESEIVISEKVKEPKPKPPTAKERRAAELAAMTPEQRRLRLASEATRKKLAALKRAGKIKSEVLEAVEIMNYADGLDR